MANRLFDNVAGITVLVLLSTVNVRYSAAVNPLYIPSWRCSSTNAEYYNYFGNGPVGKTDAFCTRVGATAPSLADFISPCLSAFSRDLAHDAYLTTEFGLTGDLCYPNRNGACTNTSNVLYICKPSAVIPINSTTQCPFLTAANGLFEYPTGRQSPSYARLVCDSGYKLANPASWSRQCRVDGNWSPTHNPTCSVVTCPTTQAIAGGYLQITDVVFSSTSALRCNTLKAVNGGNTSVCQSDGTWSQPTGLCIAIPPLTCATVPKLRDGNLVLTNSTAITNTATLVCDRGYLLVGNAHSTCLSNGSWSRPSGTCEITCPLYQTVTNGLLSITSNTVSSTATTVCNVNYVLVGGGSSTCQSVGTWSTLEGACQARCTSPPTVSNGRFLFGSDNPGSTASVVCNIGYTLIGGTGTSTCTVGTWSTPAGGCQTTCPGNGVVENGVLSIAAVTVNSVAYTVCNGDYVLVGDGRATCQSSGNWSKPTGACQARCVNLRQVSNGRFLFSNDSPGSTATVVCNGGYRLNGGAGTSTCTSGSWTSPAGICLATTGGCPLAQIVANGLLSIFTNVVASTAVAVCNANYALVGDGRSTCQSDLTWSTPTGACQARCINIPVVSNGDLLFRSDNPGSTATVVCNPGYALTFGAATATCASGVWTLPAGTCQIPTVPTTRAAPTTTSGPAATPSCPTSLGATTAGIAVGVGIVGFLLGAVPAVLFVVFRQRQKDYRSIDRSTLTNRQGHVYFTN